MKQNMPGWTEGFTEYMTTLSENYVNNKKPDFPHKSSYDRYYLLAGSGLEQAQTTHSDRYDYNFAYVASAYSKGSVFLAQLGYVIGMRILKRHLKDIMKSLSSNTPSPNDFKRIAEKVSDLELEWYLNDWTRTNHKIDYGLDISSLVFDRSITVKRKARMPMPIEIEVSFADGSADIYYIPTDLMHGNKKFSSKNIFYMDPWTWTSPNMNLLLKEIKKS